VSGDARQLSVRQRTYQPIAPLGQLQIGGPRMRHLALGQWQAITFVRAVYGFGRYAGIRALAARLSANRPHSEADTDAHGHKSERSHNLALRCLQATGMAGVENSDKLPKGNSVGTCPA
jgi:hypothetical protein